MTAGWGWALALASFVAILVLDSMLVVGHKKSMTRWMREQAAENPWVPLLAGLAAGLTLGHLYL